MKPFLKLFFLSLALFSCSANKLQRDSLPEQTVFQPLKTDAGTWTLTVSSYDTASSYDSPYQRYMIDNGNKPDGEFMVYDEKGKLRRTLFYKNHKREGKDTWFYADGQIMQEKLFVNDRYVSYKSFYPKRNMADTELDDTLGYKRHWDEEGNLVFEKNYRTGAYKEWYPNGKIRASGIECPGECFSLEGPWKYYDTKGNLDQIIFYKGTSDPNDWDSIYHYRGNQVTSIERK